MTEEPKCCTGVPMAENMAEDGYCCAKPTDEELVEAQEEADRHSGPTPREEADAQLFGQDGLMYRGAENTALALEAHAIVILHTDGTYEVIKNRYAGLNFGAAVYETTVLYLKRDGIRVMATVTGRVRLYQPYVSEVDRA